VSWLLFYGVSDLLKFCGVILTGAITAQYFAVIFSEKYPSQSPMLRASAIKGAKDFDPCFILSA
jgi:hypothetical protein